MCKNWKLHVRNYLVFSDLQTMFWSFLSTVLKNPNCFYFYFCLFFIKEVVMLKSNQYFFWEVQRAEEGPKTKKETPGVLGFVYF